MRRDDARAGRRERGQVVGEPVLDAGSLQPDGVDHARSRRDARRGAGLPAHSNAASDFTTTAPSAARSRYGASSAPWPAVPDASITGDGSSRADPHAATCVLDARGSRWCPDGLSVAQNAASSRVRVVALQRADVHLPALLLGHAVDRGERRRDRGDRADPVACSRPCGSARRRCGRRDPAAC